MTMPLTAPRAATTLWHLCLHEVRVHRRLLFAWVLIAAAHPLVASMNWFGPSGPRGALMVMLLPLARVLVMAVIVAGMVHGDSPIDERAFWRTRPVPAPLLAASKALVAGGAFVLAPAALVTAAAWYFGIPLSDWPALLVQVVVTEAAAVGLVLTVATRTRVLPTLLLGAVFVVATFMLLISAIERLGRLPWVIERGLMADPQLAFWADLVVIAVAVTGLFFIGYRGPGERHRFAAGVLGSVLALIGVWFVPALRAERPGTPAFTMDLADAHVWAERLTRDGKQIGIVVQPRVTPLRPGDTFEMTLLDGQLQTPAGVRAARRASDPRN
ncbi:MAG TPA: hypothetical protein VMF13_18330, partial [Luteitalea sp.]|nr:hypothetical protein [Luteitalea sp.]